MNQMMKWIWTQNNFQDLRANSYSLQGCKTLAYQSPANAMHLFYLKKPSGLSTDNSRLKPIIYQPTPAGVATLCLYYSRRYKIDLSTINLEKYLSCGDNLIPKFSFLRDNPKLIDVSEGKHRGLVLCHGQFHAIPLMLSKYNGKTFITVFDSTSGAQIKGYFRIANLFPEAVFMLNSGTRQADGISCITDAICLLKEALQQTDILSLLLARQVMQHRSFDQTLSRFPIPKPDNFILFDLPERLLLTAQRNQYLKDVNADLSVKIRGGHSLGYYRKMFLIKVLLKGDNAAKDINGYLFLKSQQHKMLLKAAGPSFSYKNHLMMIHWLVCNFIDQLREQQTNTFDKQLALIKV